MTAIYVVVYCGYEGIDRVLWAGEGADAARERVLAYRERCRRIGTVRPRQRYGRIARGWESMGEPDRVCVMCQNDGNQLYACCCAALSVQPSETVLL